MSENEKHEGDLKESMEEVKEKISHYKGMGINVLEAEEYMKNASGLFGRAKEEVSKAKKLMTYYESPKEDDKLLYIVDAIKSSDNLCKMRGELNEYTHDSTGRIFEVKSLIEHWISVYNIAETRACVHLAKSAEGPSTEEAGKKAAEAADILNPIELFFKGLFNDMLKIREGGTYTNFRLDDLSHFKDIKSRAVEKCVIASDRYVVAPEKYERTIDPKKTLNMLRLYHGCIERVATSFAQALRTNINLLENNGEKHLAMLITDYAFVLEDMLKEI